MNANQFNKFCHTVAVISLYVVILAGLLYAAWRLGVW